MILGTVNSEHEIMFSLPILDSRGNEHQIEAILDTGFNGSLTLPPTTILQLGLAYRSRTLAEMADGTIGRLDVFAATIMWDRVVKSIAVESLDTSPLLGMSLLVNFDLQVRVTAGSLARLTAVP
jgi:clan AA aspartic protease